MRTDHKLVMAHVYGHCDFFKNNHWFSRTNRHMIDDAANHGNRIRRYMNRYGVETVENFIDACLSLEDLIDIHSPFIRRQEDAPPGGENDEPPEPQSGRFKAKGYMDGYINPQEAMQREQESDARNLSPPSSSRHGLNAMWPSSSCNTRP